MEESKLEAPQCLSPNGTEQSKPGAKAWVKGTIWNEPRKGGAE